MTTKEEKDAKNEDEMRDRLKKQVDAIITELQSDVHGMRCMGGSKHIIDGARDEVFDEVEKVFINIVRQGKALEEGDDAHDAIGEIAWATMEFIEETAHERIKLDTLVLDKCEELVKGNAYVRWMKKKRAKVSDNISGGQSE